MPFQLHPTTLSDQARITELYHKAFSPEEADLVAQLATDLLKSPETDSIVAKTSGDVCGHIAFSPLRLSEDPNYRAMILAPLAVTPKLQKQGIGSQLIRHGLTRYKASDLHDIYVYGDPDYYGRFGFIETDTTNIEAPYALSHPFGWQCLRLNGHNPTSGKLVCVEALQNPQLW